MASQSGASLVHFIAPCDPQTAQSFDRLRMKGKRLRMKGKRLRMKGKRLRMKGKRLRMKGKRLSMMVGGKNEIN